MLRSGVSVWWWRLAIWNKIQFSFICWMYPMNQWRERGKYRNKNRNSKWMKKFNFRVLDRLHNEEWRMEHARTRCNEREHFRHECTFQLNEISFLFTATVWRVVRVEIETGRLSRFNSLLHWNEMISVVIVVVVVVLLATEIGHLSEEEISMWWIDLTEQWNSQLTKTIWINVMTNATRSLHTHVVWPGGG